jgi:1-acyl-sn-glycerol-3-phosphate acyltransferase
VILQAIARGILKICGWTATGQVPDLDKAVFIAAPHTSNWDGFWLIIYKTAMNVRLGFLAKHTLFWWPLSSLLRRFGAIPIDRSQATSTVQQMIDAFADEDLLWLAMAPEGTRKRMPFWKTGFYQIALAADVPIVMTYIDYSQKKLGIGPQLRPSGIVANDLAIIGKFYEPFTPRHPALRSPIAFPPKNGEANATHVEH